MNFEINSVDDFIKFKYPEPEENDPDYRFFRSWGYEQYLIKKFKYDLEGLRVIEGKSYNMFRLAKMLDGKTPEEACKGFPLVRAKKILHGFLMNSVAKSWLGILLWKEDDKYFCLFPGFGPFQNLIRLFSDDEVEVTDDVFVDEQDLIDKCDKCRVYSIFQIENHVCHLPDIGNCFVNKVWSNASYRGSFTLDYVIAERDEKKDRWIYPKGKKNLIRSYGMDYSNIEEARILQ